MNKNLICPKCDGELIIDNYKQQHPSGFTMCLSRLICPSPCTYVKEFPVPEVLFSETLGKDIERKEVKNERRHNS